MRVAAVKRFQLLVCVGVAIAWWGGACRNVAAQATASPATATPATATPITADSFQAASGWASQAERESQYKALARDVDAMQRELGIVKRVVKLVTPTAVHIEAQPLAGVATQLQVEEEGSGVVAKFGSRFFILTNRHVIRHSTKSRIRIRFADGRIAQPTRIWADPETDVAVMAVDIAGLVPARIGNSDALDIGDHVLAIGSPFGLSQSVTRGIVSAKGRYDLDLGDGELQYMNFIQTDAAINPGNSGGPLVNLRGEVVGLNTAIASSGGGNEGIGFSIPINVVKRIAGELIQNRQPPRGYLGVRLDHVFDERRAQSLGLANLMGTRITKVRPDSPAELCGLMVNDIIVSYDGIRVEKDDHLISLVNLTDIGRAVDIVVVRGGRRIRKQVTVADLRKIQLDEPQ